MNFSMFGVIYVLNYIYDGSFEGLLTCIYEAFYRHENPSKIISQEISQIHILEKNINIETSTDKASKVYNSIVNKISQEVLDNVYYTYLSEYENSGKLIYEYLKLGWKLGNEVDSYLSDDRVLSLHKVVRRVGLEKHRMLGLVRFSECKGGIYYSEIEPDYNILQLIAPHFAYRMADQNWVIHDTKRSLAAIYNMKHWVMTELSLTSLPELTQREEFYQALWKKYYSSISIKERENPRLQLQYMPRRYWSHLVERQ